MKSQLRLSDCVDNDRSSTSTIPLRILACARDGLSVPQTSKLLAVNRHSVWYHLKRFEKLNLMRFTDTHPKFPVLLVSFEEAKRLVELRLLTSSHVPPASTNNSTRVPVFHAHVAPTSESAANGGLSKTAGEGAVLPSASLAVNACRKGNIVDHLQKARESSARTPALSVHRFKVKFALRGRVPKECDRLGKNGRKYWYLRDLGEGGVCVEATKKWVFVSVYGVPKCARVADAVVRGVEIARDSLLEWARARGVRVDSRGELCGGAHFVVDDVELAARVKKLLDLNTAPKSFAGASGLAKWFIDKSHEGKVEVEGVGALEQVKAFEWLVSGGLQRELTEIGGIVREWARPVKSFSEFEKRDYR